jgi:hypothetical protein
MKILVKFPTRERPDKFYEYLVRCIQMQETEDVKYQITLDDDDPKLKEYEEILANMADFPVQGYISKSGSKVAACNRDMDLSGQWDICLLMSDDMWCLKQGWDRILIEEMSAHYPDMDGVLFHPDGRKDTAAHNGGRGLNTMCIVGRKYYERFNYLYHPDYQSLCCDDEFTEVADMLGKQFRAKEMLFQHKHYSSHPEIKADRLMQHNESLYKRDRAVYVRRKANKFK